MILGCPGWFLDTLEVSGWLLGRCYVGVKAFLSVLVCYNASVCSGLFIGCFQMILMYSEFILMFLKCYLSIDK